MRRLYDGQLLPDTLAHTLRNVETMFPTREVASAAPRALPERAVDWGPLRFIALGRQMDMVDYLCLQRVAQKDNTEQRWKCADKVILERQL